MYFIHEVLLMLARVGSRDVSVHGGYTEAPATATGTMLVVARKCGQCQHVRVLRQFSGDVQRSARVPAAPLPAVDAARNAGCQVARVEGAD